MLTQETPKKKLVASVERGIKTLEYWSLFFFSSATSHFKNEEKSEKKKENRMEIQTKIDSVDV